jgi:hypothetical protein
MMILLMQCYGIVTEFGGKEKPRRVALRGQFVSKLAYFTGKYPTVETIA